MWSSFAQSFQAKDQPAQLSAGVSAPPPSSESTAAAPLSSSLPSVCRGLHDPVMTEAAKGMKVGTGADGGVEVEDSLVEQAVGCAARAAGDDGQS